MAEPSRPVSVVPDPPQEERQFAPEGRTRHITYY